VFTPGTDYNFNHGDYRVRQLNTNGTFNFSFRVPFNFGALTVLELVAIQSSATPSAAANIDLFSDYGMLGQASNFFSESDLTTTYVIPAVNVVFSYDISSVYSSIAALQFCGLMVDHNAIGGALDYLGIRMVYTTA
jgi:hypothetical protein